MGQRGPASTVETQLTAARRREIDELLVGSPTVREVYESQKLGAAGISETAFYRYAARLRWETRLKYIGDLVTLATGQIDGINERGLAKSARLIAMQRVIELLDDDTLATAKVSGMAHAIADLNRAAATEAAEARKTKTEKAASEIGEIGKRRNIDADVLAEIEQKVMGLI